MGAWLQRLADSSPVCICGWTTGRSYMDACHWWPQPTPYNVVLATWPTACFDLELQQVLCHHASDPCGQHDVWYIQLCYFWLSDAGSTKPEFAKNDRRRTGWINQNITWGAPHYRKIFGQKTSARLRICSPIIPSTFKTCRILRSPVYNCGMEILCINAFT